MAALALIWDSRESLAGALVVDRDACGHSGWVRPREPLPALNLPFMDPLDDFSALRTLKRADLEFLYLSCTLSVDNRSPSLVDASHS